ncbi:MAG: MGMT family protein [Candidatus Methanomethylicus sp.]|nr:MGMT family protein [Candidatus Methanomethylicus sp.]
MAKKTDTEKLRDSKDFPRIVPISTKMSKRWGTGTIVIPTPMEVYELMSQIPNGKLATINDLRAALAKKHGATIACPICTGIFARIAAGASEEGRGVEKIAYWRTLKVGGVLNEKYPGGAEAQSKLLELEGHTVKKKGSRYIVENYGKKLAAFD